MARQYLPVKVPVIGVFLKPKSGFFVCLEYIERLPETVELKTNSKIKVAITKEKKKEIVSSLKDAVQGSGSVVFVNFNKLLVSQASELRRALKKENISYKVAKKTLFKKVLEGSGTKGDMPALEGEFAIAYGKDLISPAREVYSFQKKLDGKVNIIGGIFDGEYKSLEEMVGIASIPSMDVLRGMFVNVINSPIQRLAIVLNQIATK